MNKIYLDNAATTPLNEQVIEEMLSVMRNHYLDRKCPKKNSRISTSNSR